MRHHGAPNDRKPVAGEDVIDLGRSFIELPDDVMIPYHRVLWIERDGERLWSRREWEAQTRQDREEE